MIFEALLAGVLIALTSLTGAFFFGNNKKLLGAQRFVVGVPSFASVVIEGTCARAVAEGAEGPHVQGVGESSVADEPGEHDFAG